MKQSLDAYRRLLNLQEASFSRIVHEDAMVATVYRSVMRNGKRFILKISKQPLHTLREVLFLKQFADILPLPKIIQVIEPTSEIDGAILMEYLPGELLRTENLTEALAYELGGCLAAIHQKRFSGYGDPALGHLGLDPRSYFTMKFKEGFDECKSNLPSSLLDRSLKYFQSNLNLLKDLDGPCAAHRDYRPGNIIVHEGRLKGIIDWAGARASFAEEDLCSLEHGEWLLNPILRKSFLDGYASVRPIPDYHRLIPFLSLNKAIATIGFTVKQGTWQKEGALIYQRNRKLLEALQADQYQIQ